MSSSASRAPAAPPRLLDQACERVRYRHGTWRTEQAYVHWARAFVRVHGLRHPKAVGHAEVEAFLAWLSAERRVSVPTHRQALSALLFPYQQVFGQSWPWMQAIGRPARKPRPPVVLSVGEVRGGASWGWFWRRPLALDWACAESAAAVAALRLLSVFPHAVHSVCPRIGVVRRHPLHDRTFQRAFARAVRQARITRPAMPHMLRRCFATRLLQSGTDIIMVQKLLGHSDVGTTTIHAPVLKVAAGGARSPLDALAAGSAPATSACAMH